MSNNAVIIIGAGMVGLVLARALSQQNIHVTLIESQKPALKFAKNSVDARVSALNLASKIFLQQLQSWEYLQPQHVAPLRELIVWDDLGGGDIHFDSADVGENEMGYIIENRELLRVLWQQCSDDENITLLCPAKPKTIQNHPDHLTLTLEDGATLSARLIVGADGGQSWLRTQMSTEVIERSYYQQAIIAVVKTESAHCNVAYQSFLTTGPIGLLPLADAHQAALVWSCDHEKAQALLAMEASEFNLEMTNALHMRLGQLRLLNAPQAISLTMRHARQYVALRLALIGDAAHTIHPLAGQGVNLGFMDAQCLANVISHAAQVGKDIGAMKILRRYERARKGDNTVMIAAMRGFKELFGNESPLLIQLRSQGLNLCNRMTMLKKCFMHYAMGKKNF